MYYKRTMDISEILMYIIFVYNCIKLLYSNIYKYIIIPDTYNTYCYLLIHT